MTRKSDYDLGTSQEHTFSVTVENAKTGEHSSVLIGAKGQHRATGVIVLFDRDGLAYTRKPDGSLLLHIRAPEYDLDKGEVVTVKTTEPVEKFFPVLVYNQDDLGGEPLRQAQVRYLAYEAGQRRVLVDATGKTYTSRTDGKPGVVEDPASAKTSSKSSTKASAKKASTKKAKPAKASAKRKH